MSLVLTHCRLPDKEGRYQLWLRDGLIEKITKNAKIDGGYQIVDIGDRLLSPGFIDVHIQGAGGADILDGTQDALQTISRTLARVGTTSFLATTVVHGNSSNEHLIRAAHAVTEDLGGATLLGLHIEGPFINPKRRGGIAESCIYPPSPQALSQIFSWVGTSLRMMTIAPELPGNLEIIAALRKKNIIVSFGHSDATYEQTKTGIAAGINHVTHLFNAMPPLNHRQPGPLLAIFEDKSISAQIISDGVHLHPQIVRFAYRLLGLQRCVCITDGVQAMGLPEGRYRYNGREYESKDGTARYLDGTLIGSALPLAQMVKRFQHFTGCSLAEAIDTGTRHPAHLLGLDHQKGSLTEGKDADLVVLEEDFSAWMTMVKGKIVWAKESIPS